MPITDPVFTAGVTLLAAAALVAYGVAVRRTRRRRAAERALLRQQSWSFDELVAAVHKATVERADLRPTADLAQLRHDARRIVEHILDVSELPVDPARRHELIEAVLDRIPALRPGFVPPTVGTEKPRTPPRKPPFAGG